MRGLHAFAEALELAAHDIGAQADSLVAEREEADAQRALGQAAAFDLWRLLDEASELPVPQLELVDRDSVAGDGDLRAATHGPIVAAPSDS